MVIELSNDSATLVLQSSDEWGAWRYNISHPFSKSRVQYLGVFPQHQSMSEGYDYNAPNSIRHLPLYAPADIEPNLNTIIIEPGAKETDLLSSSVFVGAFLISTKFKTLLQRFTLAPHTFYPAPIRHGAKPPTAEYHLLHTPHLSRVAGWRRPSFARSSPFEGAALPPPLEVEHRKSKRN